MKHRKTDEYRYQTAEKVLKALQSDLHLGLESAQVDSRLTEVGPNEIDERTEPL